MLYLAAYLMNMKRDSPILGFVIGLVLPLVGLFVMYTIWGSHEGVFEFVKGLTHRRGMATKVFTLSLLTNLIPFAYCNIKRIDYTMRGIFVITMIYVALIVMAMFVW